jgi:integrase
MAAKLERTRYPGVYKRGSRYVAIYRVGGRQRQEACRTLGEARKVRAARQADVARGEFSEQTTLTFNKYASEWVERYHGRGRGFRESTRDDYERALTMYAFPFFDERHRRTVSQISPRDIANFIGWLCDEDAMAVLEREHVEQEARRARAQGKRPRKRTVPARKRLSDNTVRNILNPVRACLATAVQEGLIRHNPAQGIALPHRPLIDDEDDRENVRPLTREQLATLLDLVPARHRTMFRLLAATGLRISELIALQWRHVKLDGSQPHVAVRRAIVRGRVQAPKSRHGRRDVPLGPELVSELRRHRTASEWPREGDPVFPSLAAEGTPLEPGNLRRRVLAPAAEEAGVAWAGFHTFRHTCASLLFDEGRNVKQVQRWLGHHSASFTLDTYVHLLSDDIGEPLAIDRPGVPADGGRAALSSA